MRQTISYIIKFLIIGLIIIGLFFLTLFYLLEFYNYEEIMTLNFILILIVAILQYGLVILNYKTHFGDIPNDTISYKLTNSKIKEIAIRRQLNFFSITSLILGLLNLILFLFAPYPIDRLALFSAIFILVPIVGYFESIKELKTNFEEKEVTFSRHNDLFIFELADNRIELKIDDLRFLKKIDKFLILQNIKTKEKLIITLNQ